MKFISKPGINDNILSEFYSFLGPLYLDVLKICGSCRLLTYQTQSRIASFTPPTKYIYFFLQKYPKQNRNLYTYIFLRVSLLAPVDGGVCFRGSHIQSTTQQNCIILTNYEVTKYGNKFAFFGCRSFSAVLSYRLPLFESKTAQ